jgi:hypothetical protein
MCTTSRKWSRYLKDGKSGLQIKASRHQMPLCPELG